MKKERLQSSGLNKWNDGMEESACGVWSKGDGWVESERGGSSKAKRQGKEGDYFALALIQEQASHWLNLARIKRAQTHYDSSKSRN
jgi:hypothetical protein